MRRIDKRKMKEVQLDEIRMRAKLVLEEKLLSWIREEKEKINMTIAMGTSLGFKGQRDL